MLKQAKQVTDRHATVLFRLLMFSRKNLAKMSHVYLSFMKKIKHVMTSTSWKATKQNRFFLFCIKIGRNQCPTKWTISLTDIVLTDMKQVVWMISSMGHRWELYEFDYMQSEGFMRVSHSWNKLDCMKMKRKKSERTSICSKGWRIFSFQYYSKQQNEKNNTKINSSYCKKMIVDKLKQKLNTQIRL